MTHAHHIPPHRTPIAVISPTLRRASLTAKHWRIANALTLGAVLLAVVLSVSLSSAGTDRVCAMPLDGSHSAMCH
jgi:hypothetical protein